MITWEIWEYTWSIYLLPFLFLGIFFLWLIEVEWLHASNENAMFLFPNSLLLLNSSKQSNMAPGFEMYVYVWIVSTFLRDTNQNYTNHVAQHKKIHNPLALYNLHSTLLSSYTANTLHAESVVWINKTSAPYRGIYLCNPGSYPLTSPHKCG